MLQGPAPNSHHLCIRRQRFLAESALSCSPEDYVPALLAMSQGLIIQKQVTKARNQLKRIADLAKKGYNPERQQLRCQCCACHLVRQRLHIEGQASAIDCLRALCQACPRVAYSTCWGAGDV